MRLLLHIGTWVGFLYSRDCATGQLASSDISEHSFLLSEAFLDARLALPKSKQKDASQLSTTKDTSSKSKINLTSLA